MEKAKWPVLGKRDWEIFQGTDDKKTFIRFSKEKKDIEDLHEISPEDAQKMIYEACLECCEAPKVFADKEGRTCADLENIGKEKVNRDALTEEEKASCEHYCVSLLKLT